MLCGLQGNGKTTHAAKLAKYFIKQGRRPCWWPAISTALRPSISCRWWASRRCPGVHPAGRKAAGDRQEGAGHAKDYGNDIVILDTAGRLQIDEC